jgi:hypothetical protein
MPRRSRRSRRPRATPEGFKWQGNKLVPLEGTTFNEETQEWEVGKKQSGNDWGMGDPLEGSGSDIMDMDPNSPEFAAAMAAEMEAGPTEIPGETDSSGFSSDYTDSGQQTTTDPEDTDDSGDFDPGSEVNTFTKDEDGNTVVTTDTYGISGDESTMTTTTETVSEEDDEYGGKGYAQRTKGYNPFLKIKKESKGKKGVFSRGSLRVRKPKRMAV